MLGSHRWYLFHKEVKSWDSTTWFRIWKFQTLAWKRYLHMHLLTEHLIFWGRWSVFSERGIQDQSYGTNVASNKLANFLSVFTPIVYGFNWSVLELVPTAGYWASTIRTYPHGSTRRYVVNGNFWTPPTQYTLLVTQTVIAPRGEERAERNLQLDPHRARRAMITSLVLLPTYSCFFLKPGSSLCFPRRVMRRSPSWVPRNDCFRR